MVKDFDNAYRKAKGRQTVAVDEGGAVQSDGNAPEGDLIRPEAPAWPDPPAPEAYHGLAGDVVSRIEPETEADPAAILIQYLVAFGNAAGRVAFCPVGRRRHYQNLYCVLVGSTSYGGKGESWGWVDALVSGACPEWHTESVMGGLSSGEGLIKVGQDVREDGGRRILAVEEEFARVLAAMGREHSTLSAVLRQGWDGDRLRVMTRQNPLRADKVHVSLIGHVTPDELRRCMAGTEQNNGFANRILWAAVRRSQLLPEGGLELDLADLQVRTREAVAHSRDVQYVTRTAAARRLWAEEYPRLRAERPGLLGAVTTRAAAQVLRLSLVYAMLERRRSVDVPELEAALALWDYCERTCKWLFGGGVTGDKLADDILAELLRNKQGMTRDEIRNAVGSRNAAELTRCLNVLNRQGLAQGRSYKTGGRPAERWVAATHAESAESAESDGSRTYGDGNGAAT